MLLAALVALPAGARAVCDANLPEQISPDPAGRRLDVVAGATSPTACTYNSPGTPYGTIVDAARCAVAGDTIYVHAGTYHGRQSLWNLAGSPGAWILVTKAPNESGPVVFTGDGAIKDAGVGVIDIYDSRYVALGPGFDIGNGGTSRGVNVLADAAPVDHVIVFGNTVHDNRGAGILFGTWAGGTISDVGAFGNTLYENATDNRPPGGGFPNGTWGGNGGWPASLATGQYGGQSCVHFRRNDVSRSYGECIDQQAVDGGSVTGNTVHQCFNTSILLDASRSIRVDGNYVYEADGSFFRNVNGTATPPVSVLMGVEAAAGYPHTGHVIVNNIVDGTRGITYNIWNGAGNSTYGNLTIAHNTIVRPWGTAIDVERPPGGQLPFGPNFLDNDIAFGSSALAVADPQYWNIHDNDFPGGRPAFVDASNVTFDPLLAGPAYGNPAGYKLSGSSPALHAGTGEVSATVSRDYFGATRSSTAPSIGADEGAATPSAPTFTSSASASPSSVAPGATSSLAATVTNTSSTALTNGILDLEVYDSAGRQVSQSACNVSVAAGASASCSFAWTAPSTAAAYTIKVGVFGSGWAPLYHWNNGAGSVTVATAPATPTFTSAASASPSSVAPGGTSTFDATVTNTSSAVLTNGILDVEVYDSAGRQVSQSTCNANVAAGASASCSFAWAAPSTSGTYTIKVGVFGSGWTPLYHWNNGAGSVTVATAPATPTFTSAASASPSSVAPGATSTLAATVTNTSTTALANAIIDVEVYDAAGTPVSQSACAGMNVAAAASGGCSFSWTAPSATGTYAIKVGVFGAGWAPLYHWNNGAGSVSVTTGGTGTSGAAAFATRLGRPARLLVGAGGEKAWVQNAGLSIDILDHYLTYLPGQSSWIYWSVDAKGPGAFVTSQAGDADSIGAVPMFTHYGLGAYRERDGNLLFLGDWNFMSTYWESVKILFGRLGAFPKPALVNLEPDLWGYAERASADPTAISVSVASEGTECSGLPDHLAGMAQCYVRLARQLAPNAMVGMMPSRWGGDSFKAVADFMLAAHAGDGDFIPIETSDRDAGCYEVQCGGGTPYWGSSDYDAHFAMAQLFHQTLGKPLVWWQTPLGVPSDTPGGSSQHYRDNRVQTFFANPGRLVSAGGAAMVFGAGRDDQTQLWTDGGQLGNVSRAYYANPVALP